LNLAQLGTAVSALESHGLITVSFILITAGFLIKGAHRPLPLLMSDAHSVAPTPYQSSSLESWWNWDYTE